MSMGFFKEQEEYMQHFTPQGYKPEDNESYKKRIANHLLEPFDTEETEITIINDKWEHQVQ